MNRTWPGVSVVIGAAACSTSMSLAAPKADERIRIYEGNKYYWQYKGKPLLLLGGSDEDNLFNDPEMMMRDLKNLQSCGGNFIRGTLSWRDENNAAPYLKKGDKFDLTRFNPDFFNRLARCCREGMKRDIIMQIEVWASWDFYFDRWKSNPFNPANNINYTTRDTKLTHQWPHRPWRNLPPFFRSVPKQNNDTVLLKYQQAFVRKVLNTTLKYPNVLYCLGNETCAHEPWVLYWGKFLKAEAAKRGRPIEVTEMIGDGDLREKSHRWVYQHPEIFSFADVSQNNWNEGQTHYERLIWYREKLNTQKGGPRPMNNVKVYGADNPQSKRIESMNIDRFWKNIFAGCAGTRFHRPGLNAQGIEIGGLGLNKEAQGTIRAARTFTDAFNIFKCEPRPDLLSDREKDEAYCLAETGKSFAVYFPKGGQVTLNPDGANGSMIMRWFDPVKVEFLPKHKISVETVGGITESIKLASPDTKQPWLILVQKK
ncbi:MAG: hypothetical protein JSV03_03940 [Planctomycetota bacterium]|nr:MAG: hypothetical protein JSV03_03940 [Planctomycetota bacterium]